MSDEIQFPDQLPTFDVWNHLEAGLQMARGERTTVFQVIGRWS